MGTPTSSNRALLGGALMLFGGLFVLFGAMVIALAVFMVVTGDPLFAGHIPAIAPAIQGLIMAAGGVLAFRKGRKIVDATVG